MHEMNNSILHGLVHSSAYELIGVMRRDINQSIKYDQASSSSAGGE
jgi:hypothetical protein